MKLVQLYKKEINRDLNPAVSADDVQKSTVDVEINEYVFTDDIINGLRDVLFAVKDHKVSHNGIWINGFFGSGKSHFLKYAGYCLDEKYREAALERLQEAVKERDPLSVPSSKSNFSISEFNDLKEWIKKSEIELVLFNIGTVSNTNADQNTAFTEIFWNEFNRHRGYNSVNLALAQNLEKILDEEGQFEEFKQRIKGKGYNWDTQAVLISKVKLDMALAIAKELIPELSTDVIRQSIKENKENISPEAFCMELQQYIAKKNNEKFRLIFLVDEVSQFISDRKYLLLQLQEVVTGLNKYCKEKAWVACTAQQDLSQLMSSMQISQSTDVYGQIMGRFEVRVALKGTQTEYITQKRLLDKNYDGIHELSALYAEKKSAIENQFSLPASFDSFDSEDDFINYYPFVPYQFKLIMKVLDAFGNLKYIDVQAKGNERSVIKITHSTAISTMNNEVGKFISFDQMYNSMVQGALMAAGQKAIENALSMIQKYEDQPFAERLVHILFMICNLSEPDQLLFPATQENLVTLMMDDVDVNKAELIARVEKALAFLDHQHIIRVEHFNDGRADVYCFQTEDEIDAAREIDSLSVEPHEMAERFVGIFRNYFKCNASSNKERYGSRDFNIQWNVYGKNYFSNNPDIVVDFSLGTVQTDNTLFGANEPNKLTFSVQEEMNKDRLLVNDFYWYCQVEKFASQQSNSEAREKTRLNFSARALEVFNTRIVPKMNAIMGKCRILSGNTEIQVQGEGSSRYKNALEIHFGNVYPFAKYASDASVPQTQGELQSKIMRKINPGEYGPLNPLTPAEEYLDMYISGQIGTVYVSDVIRTFAARPYGWSDVATAYFLNELRRRQKRAFKYNNDTNIENSVIANNLLREQNRFTIIAATAISQDLINEFIEAWKYALNQPQAPACYDSGDLFRMCKETAQGENHISIQTILHTYRLTRNELASYPFVSVVDDAIKILDSWEAERDHKKFFELVIADRETAKEVFDKYKDVYRFKEDNLKRYKEVREFAERNRDNFEFIKDRSKVDDLQNIFTDERPRMRAYNQLVDEIKKQLAEVAATKKEHICKVYDETFQELQQIAAENGVAYTINESYVLQSLTSGDNINTLDRQLNKVADYRANAIEEIMNRRKVTTSVSQQSHNGEATEVSEPPAAKVRPIRWFNLKTGSKKQLRTEADVDEYLQELKKQLMAEINSFGGDHDIMVK